MGFEKVTMIVFTSIMKSWFIYCSKGLSLLVTVLFLFSCAKKETMPDYSKAKFTVVMKSGTNHVIWDSMNYMNAAGNKYSVETVNMYISNVTFKAPGKVFSSKYVFYIDPRNSSKNTFFLDSIPPADYTEMTFLVGLDTDRNKTWALPNTTDNLIMGWPDPMGGGYHFMKLEGHYLDTLNVKKGYAIHLGKNENLVTAKVTAKLHQQLWDHRYTLSFDVNEVFANPYTYNLNFEPSYTMSDSLGMLKIKNNMHDAFTLSQDN